MKITNNIMRFLIVFMLLAAIALPGVSFGQARDARVTSTIFTVDTLSEGWDANPGDGVCATSGGKCTLRAAILETNALAGADTIILPAGNYEMTIDGTLEDDSVTSTWTIEYDGPPWEQTPPITGIPIDTRGYILSGLTNYIWYTVTLNAMLGEIIILSDTVIVMPTDRIVYLPLVLMNEAINMVAREE